MKQKYFLSLETCPVEKEVVENIKNEVQKKLILPNPRNRAKQHASHVTLGIMQFSPSEELETAKLIEEVLQDFTDLKAVDLTKYNAFKDADGETVTIHLEPVLEHEKQLININQKLKQKLKTFYYVSMFFFAARII